MDKINKNESTKTANQAWRKKPRKFAPKSRQGCKTCKTRRIKCDLSRPSCLKCQSTGRTCDGYSEIHLTFETEIGSPSHYHHEKHNGADGCNNNSHPPCTTIDAYQQPKQWHAEYHGLIVRNLGPFMILPVTGSAQTEAMYFFEYVSIKHLNEYQPCESWRKTLMFFAQTVPAVRDAAIALALIHQNYLNGFSSDRPQSPHRPQPLECRPSDRSPLLHYNRAIQLLLNLDFGDDSTETTAITLLVCYLFSCFDHLAGNHVQAVKHLRGGVELSRNIDKALLNNNDIYDDAKPSGVPTVICQVARQIRRLDAQAVTFLIDWTPADVQEGALTPQFPPFDSAFRSLEQAADQLQILVARVMILHYTAQRQMSPPVDEIPSSPLPPKDIVLGQLETWLSLFENMLQLGNSDETDSETYPLISLLRLQHTISWTLLSGHGPGGEMEYDKFLPQFRQCVALAGYVAAAHERYSGSLKPTFTPEIGIVPVLYIIGVKCRHPVVRREALSILRQQPIREAVWDSIYAARVVERAIEIEEDGHGERGTAKSMEQIAVWRRIESMSWADVVDGKSPARLDIAYTFCSREGMHMESLII